MTREVPEIVEKLREKTIDKSSDDHTGVFIIDTEKILNRLYTTKQ